MPINFLPVDKVFMVFLNSVKQAVKVVFFSPSWSYSLSFSHTFFFYKFSSPWDRWKYDLKWQHKVDFYTYACFLFDVCLCPHTCIFLTCVCDVFFLCALVGSLVPRGLRLSLILIPLTTVEYWTAQPSENANSSPWGATEWDKETEEDKIERDFDGSFLCPLAPCFVQRKIQGYLGSFWHFDYIQV